MPTTNVVNSTLFAVYTGSTPTLVGHQNDATISFSHAPRDITTKNSAGHAEFLEGLRSWEGSMAGFVAFDDTNGALALHDSYNNRTVVEVRFSTEVTGDTYFSGNAYVSNLEVASPGQEDNLTYNVTFQGTGALTKGTVS